MLMKEWIVDLGFRYNDNNNPGSGVAAGFPASQLVILESLRLLNHSFRGVGDHVTFVVPFGPARGQLLLRRLRLKDEGSVWREFRDD